MKEVFTGILVVLVIVATYRVLCKFIKEKFDAMLDDWKF